jgi:biotin carboxyl carrier protein
MKCEITASSFGGSVESHVASVGHDVALGAVILTIECMKTMFPVEATAAGRILWIRPCGETFETGDVLAILEVA